MSPHLRNAPGIAAILVWPLAVAALSGVPAGPLDAPAPLPAADALKQADRLHTDADRTGEGQPVRSLREELSVLRGALTADADSYDLLWRAARAECQMGEHLSGKGKSEALERAMDFGRRAVDAQADRVEGHYWLGASYGRAAEARGGVGAYLLARKLRAEMEAVLRLQPAYEGGDAFLALGELDRGLPRLLGGNRERGRRYFEEGLRIAPDNADLKLALAKADLGEHRDEEARALLEALVAPTAAPPVAASVSREARQLLESLGRVNPAVGGSPQ